MDEKTKNKLMLFYRETELSCLQLRHKITLGDDRESLLRAVKNIEIQLKKLDEIIE